MQRLMLAYAATGLASGFARRPAITGFLAAQSLRLIRAGAGQLLRSLLFALVWSCVASVAPHPIAAHLKSPATLAATIVAQLAL